jgi:formylmethanofuran dehydrogenase subunit E
LFKKRSFPIASDVRGAGGVFMQQSEDLNDDFQRCVSFHGHSCPGLALGYAAVRAASRALNLERSPDEEVVAVVENDSCAVDAVQVLLGCTFGKGNLIFRNWGKQVYTFIDRSTGRAVRVSFKGPMPHSEERRVLRIKMAEGRGSEADRAKFQELKDRAVEDLISEEASGLFDVRDVTVEMPPLAQIMTTQPCAVCGELTVTGRLTERSGTLVCQECAARQD